MTNGNAVFNCALASVVSTVTRLPCTPVADYDAARPSVVKSRVIGHSCCELFTQHVHPTLQLLHVVCGRERLGGEHTLGDALCDDFLVADATHRARHNPAHSWRRASFSAFWSFAGGWMCTIYIPYTSHVYSMCLYNYVHIYQAASKYTLGDALCDDFLVAYATHRARHNPAHSCWPASFSGFWSFGGGWMCTIWIAYTSHVDSMYYTTIYIFSRQPAMIKGRLPATVILRPVCTAVEFPASSRAMIRCFDIMLFFV